MNIRTDSGMTLIELLLVLLLIAILSVIAFNAYTNFTLDAQTAVTTDKLNALKTAIVGDPRLVTSGTFSKPGFLSNCLAAPTVLTDLTVMPASGTCSVVYDPFLKHGWNGPYVSTSDANWNKDAWGTTISYTPSGSTGTIKSCGPDKTCGNSDDISVTF